MKKLVTLIALITLTLTATSRDFLGVNFGDSRGAVAAKLNGYDFLEWTANNIVISNAKFAGMDFDVVYFRFAPACYEVSFLLISKEPGMAINAYNETHDKLNKKYGNAKDVYIEGNAVSTWMDGKTKITAMFMKPKDGHDAAFSLSYNDTTQSPDDEL